MGKGKIFLNELKITETFSDFFINAVNQLVINNDKAIFNEDPVLSKSSWCSYSKIQKKSSAELIRNNVKIYQMFEFWSVYLDLIFF